MSVQRQIRQVGDTRIAIAATLVRPNGTAVDLSGLTVKFTMVSSQGVVIVAETEDDVTTTDAENGQVQYDPQAADVDTDGTYHAYFIVQTGGGAQDTFPAKTGDFRIVIEPLAY